MLTISNAFSATSSLAAATTTDAEVATPITKKATPRIQRVALHELELVYLKDATVFNSINKIVQVIMSALHEIRAKDKQVLNYFNTFTENLGTSGSSITWENLLSDIFKFQCMFGRAWIENIFNKRGNRIVDWDLIDPKTMDYAKNTRRKIVLDRFGNPIGYAQWLPVDDYFYLPHERSKVIPEYVTLQPNQLYVEPKRIAQIKFFTLGDGFYPVGLIEPIYLNSIRKQNVEEALANSIWRHGFPIIWAKVGDLQHEPTPQQIQTMLEKLKALNYKKEIATPYFYDLQMLESKHSTKLQEHLSYFQDQQIVGLGIPKPYATGLGEATNRATLNNMSDIFQLSLRDLISKTCCSIRQSMFKPLCELEGFKEVPTLDWDMVGIDELDRKTKRIMGYIKAGLLEPNLSLKEFIKKVEDID